MCINPLAVDSDQWNLTRIEAGVAIFDQPPEQRCKPREVAITVVSEILIATRQALCQPWPGSKNCAGPLDRALPAICLSNAFVSGT